MNAILTLFFLCAFDSFHVQSSNLNYMWEPMSNEQLTITTGSGLYYYCNNSYCGEYHNVPCHWDVSDPLDPECVGYKSLRNIVGDCTQPGSYPNGGCIIESSYCFSITYCFGQIGQPCVEGSTDYFGSETTCEMGD